MAYFAVTMPRSSNRSLGTAAATLRLLPLLLLLLLAAAPTGAGARPVGRAGTGGGGLGPLAAEDCAKAVPNCSQCRATKAATLCTACDFGYLVKSSGKGCCEQKKLLRYMVFGAAGGGGGGGRRALACCRRLLCRRTAAGAREVPRLPPRPAPHPVFFLRH